MRSSRLSLSCLTPFDPCREGLAFIRRIKAIDTSSACLIRLENQVHLLLKSFVVGTSLSQTTAARAAAIFGRVGLLSMPHLQLMSTGGLADGYWAHAAAGDRSAARARRALQLWV